jgi:peptide/nickel transport system substrate-binding protein
MHTMYRTLAAVAALALSAFSPLHAQTLTIGVRAGPESIDPHFSGTGNHAEALKHIFDTLVWSGDGLNLEPRLAESWKPIDDTTWEFKLRKGVKFHDGSDFTAEDAKFSIDRIPAVSGPTPTTVYVRSVKEVKIIDASTVHVITHSPAPTLPNDFVRVFVVSAKAAKNYSTKETANAGFNSGAAAVGTGPYKFVSWTPKEQLVLERFDGYWGGRQPWQRVVRREIPNDAARVAQLKAGQFDIIARVPATDVPMLERDSGLRVVKGDTIYVFTIEFDMREKAYGVTGKDGSPLPANPMRDPRVREAIDLAIDRQALAEVAMEGTGKPANQIVTHTIFGYNKSIPQPKHDLAHARKLLGDAGYPNGFKGLFLFTSDRLPGDRVVGTAVAQMLARIGLELQTSAQPAAVFFPARGRGEFSMAMWGWGTLTGEANLTLTSLVHTNDPAKRLGGFNTSGYSNPSLDKLIQAAGVEMNTDKRRVLLEQAIAMVARERPRLPLVSINTAWAMQKSKVTITPRVDEDTLAMNIKPAK